MSLMSFRENVPEAPSPASQHAEPSGRPGSSGPWSLELLPRALFELPKLRDHLAPGTSIFIPSPEGTSSAELVKAAERVRTAGFNPVPHIAARRLASRADATEFLSRLHEAARVEQILLIAGDIIASDGPYKDCSSFLRDDLLRDHGIVQAGLAGFPEGHPHLNPGQAMQTLELKVQYLEAQGIKPFIVTQFCFSPQRVLAYCASLARAFPTLGLQVGIAGPTDPLKLLRYARLCGVSASRRALSQLGTGIARLALHTDPGPLVEAIATQRTQGRLGNVSGIHVFGFGGAISTAEWIRSHQTAT